MERGIKLIVGLGNPGPSYENTRHNAGFWLVKALAKKHHGEFKLESKFKGATSNINVADHRCILLLPETFMNLSGDAVNRVIRFYKFDHTSLLVIHDELDFPSGIARLKKNGGANGHKGVQNIIDQLGNNNFWRIRIGIGKPKLKEEINNYVLSPPKKPELKEINNAIKQAITIIPELILGDFSSAMSKLHCRIHPFLENEFRG